MGCLLLLNPYLWNANGGYIGKGVESGGPFYDTGKEVWDLLIKSRNAPWGNQHIFLHIHHELPPLPRQAGALLLEMKLIENSGKHVLIRRLRGTIAL